MSTTKCPAISEDIFEYSAQLVVEKLHLYDSEESKSEK
jgi:hypothetical protein